METRKGLREARARYLELSNDVKQRRLNTDRIRSQLNHAIEQINQNWKYCPGVIGILPDDPECVEWKKRHAALETERDKIIARLRAAPDPNAHMIEIARHEGPHSPWEYRVNASMSDLPAFVQEPPRASERLLGALSGVGQGGTQGQVCCWLDADSESVLALDHMH
jgi:hypothetical protein